MKTDKFPETRLEIIADLKTYVSSAHVIYSNGKFGRIHYEVSDLDGAPERFSRTPTLQFVARRRDNDPTYIAGREGKFVEAKFDTLREALSFLGIPYADEVAEATAGA